MAAPDRSIALSPSASAAGRRVGYRFVLLGTVLAAVAWSAVSPFDRRDWSLEHLPTAAVLVFVVWYELRVQPLGLVALSLLWALCMLHVVGAHHLYSRVPYAQWFEAWFGAPWPWPSARNHYDRFVHFAFGLAALPALAELAERHVVRSRRGAILVAVAFAALLSHLYELAEWGVALVVSPEAAEAYNGQQGDPFDAQKDMALAFGGSLLSAAALRVACGRTTALGRPGSGTIP